MNRLFSALLLVGCTDRDSPIDLTNAPTSGSRHRLPHVEFDIWTDYLSLEIGLSDDCTFLEPIVDNDSVRNPPVQVFWVMYTNPNDAVDGPVIEDTFWLGDRVYNTDYENRNSMTAKGFKFPTALQQSFLTIEETSVSANGTVAESLLGSPIHARIRGEASRDEDGGCQLVTHYCPMPCTDPAEPLAYVELALGFLNSVQDVSFVTP